MHQETHLTVSRWVWYVLFRTEPCAATSYGDDHCQFWAVTVFLWLIKDVLLAKAVRVNSMSGLSYQRRSLVHRESALRYLATHHNAA